MQPERDTQTDLTPPPSSKQPRSSRVPETLRLEIASRSDVGLERGHNEDSFLVTSARGLARTDEVIETREIGEGWAALAVCDGMGGAAAGEIASRRAVEVIAEVLAAGEPEPPREVLGRRLVHALEEASRRLHHDTIADRKLTGMGTTATLAALEGETLFVAQVGDSRAYLLREGKLTQLTRDQTLARLMIEKGQLSEEDLPSFAFNNVILQAVGTSPRIDVDLTEVSVRRGDVLLVCSDGLHGPVDEAAITETLAAAPSAVAACSELIAKALEAGAPDNVTCIVARIEGGGLAEPLDPVLVKKAVLPPDPRALADTDPASDRLRAAAEAAQESRGLGPFARLWARLKS